MIAAEHPPTPSKDVIHWRRLLPLLPVMVIATLVVFEDRVSIPSCEVVPAAEYGEEEDHPDDLKVMMVANLLLLGSDAGYWNIFFRDYFLSKFFAKSFEILKPDMLLVVGDVSAKGSKLTKSKWSSVIHQFHGLLGPFLSLPFHVILGDRDIGDCIGLNAIPVNWLASSFPGLDSAGCGAFEISNVSFVSLNSVALLCGNKKLRFSVEKVIERESIDLRMDSEPSTKVLDGSSTFRLTSGLGGEKTPFHLVLVLFFYFTFHCTVQKTAITGVTVLLMELLTIQMRVQKTPKIGGLLGLDHMSYSILCHQMLQNTFFKHLGQGSFLVPILINFVIALTPMGPEITVPAMTWDARDDPGFVVASFKRNGRAVIVSKCSLARESTVIFAFISILVLFISTMLVAKSSLLTSSEG